MTNDQLFRSTMRALGEWPGFPAFDKAFTETHDVSAYLAGGAVRDLVSAKGHRPKDFDFFLGGGGVKTFIDSLKQNGSLVSGPFGSPRWFPQNISTQYADVIPISTFYNGLWRCDDILDVLNQFDITVNAVAIDLRTGSVFNPQNGLRDLERRTIRAVRFDYPDEPISETCSLTRQSVLWHRLQYYARATGFVIEPLTASWLRRNDRFAADEPRFRETFLSALPDVTNRIA